jgi:hypothetical protein
MEPKRLERVRLTHGIPEGILSYQVRSMWLKSSSRGHELPYVLPTGASEGYMLLSSGNWQNEVGGENGTELVYNPARCCGILKYIFM